MFIFFLATRLLANTKDQLNLANYNPVNITIKCYTPVKKMLHPRKMLLIQ